MRCVRFGATLRGIPSERGRRDWHHRGALEIRSSLRSEVRRVPKGSWMSRPPQGSPLTEELEEHPGRTDAARDVVHFAPPLHWGYPADRFAHVSSRLRLPVRRRATGGAATDQRNSTPPKSPPPTQSRNQPSTRSAACCSSMAPKLASALERDAASVSPATSADRTSNIGTVRSIRQTV